MSDYPMSTSAYYLARISEKDAEIERISKERNEARALFIHEQLEATRKDAEIERLKDEYESLMGRFRVYVHHSKELITELDDALDRHAIAHSGNIQGLIQQAREVTKDE